MTLLSEPLALYDEADVEQLCQYIIRRFLENHHATLEPSDREELLVYLIEEAFIAASTYDESKPYVFSAGFKRIGYYRVVDWYRSRFKDYRRLDTDQQKPDLLALDAFDLTEDATDPWNPEKDGSFTDGLIERMDAEARFDWDALSDEGQWIKDNVAVPLSEGSSQEALSRYHKKSTRWVREQLADLREELESLNGYGHRRPVEAAQKAPKRTLTPAERQELKRRIDQARRTQANA